MAASKEARRTRAASQKGTMALSAIGSSGPWEITIDQTVSGRDRWFAQIEGPSVDLYFEIPSLKIIDKAIEFLSARTESGRDAVCSALECASGLGTSRAAQIKLIRDDEFNDRFFLVIEGKRGPLARFTIAGDDLTHVIDALGQAKEELE
jgi:hypothetical protein